MKILVAPDSFKGCLTSVEVCNALKEGIKEFDSYIDIIQFPSSDGGEGFCDCMMNLFGGTKIKREVTSPLGERIFAEYVYVKNTKTAYIEFAAASGLTLVPNEERDILKSNSFGTGELIKDAIKQGAENIYVGLGGSATNDCGIGILSALGMEFRDDNHKILSAIPNNLDKIRSVDRTKMIDLNNINFVAACDVKNPLCGEFGAARVFSPQKGATESEIEFLDSASRNFAEVLGVNTDVKGYGAAGGAGMAMMAILNAKYVSGAHLLVNSQPFQIALEQADLVITGEGNTDNQSAYGKLVSVVINAAKTKGIKTIVISGGLSEGYECIGANEYYALCEDKSNLEYSIKHAYELIKDKVKLAMLNQ